MTWGSGEAGPFPNTSIVFVKHVQYPSVPAGDWLQDPLGVPKSKDAQVSFIKWCSTVGPLYPWVLHPRMKRLTITLVAEKKIQV